MINDVLSKSVHELRKELDDETYKDAYSDKLRTRLTSLIREMDEVRTELDTTEAQPKVQHITNEKYENELKEAIVGGDAVYVYDVADELSRLFDCEEYDVHYGETGWLVSNMPLSEELLKDEIRVYLPEAHYFDLTREEVIAKLSKMEDQIRASELKRALDDNGKIYLVPDNLKRNHDPNDGLTTTEVMLSDEDFTLLTGEEDVDALVGTVEAAKPVNETGS
jgi:hypothetical protein